MNTQKMFLTLTVAVFALACAGPSVAADIKDSTTHITISISSGAVSGNKGGTNTITQVLVDPEVPKAGSIDNVVRNHVIIHDNGSVSVNTFGGVSYGNGSVSDNTVTINHLGQTSGTVYGGFSFGNGNVTGNSVTMNGESGQVVGGRSDGLGAVSGNSVEISGKASGSVYGGYSTGTGDISGNTITVTNSGSALQTVGGRITNLHSTASVNNNTVTINGSITDTVFGGYTDGLGSVYNNAIFINGKVTRVNAGNITNTNNNATISGNSVTVNVKATATEVLGSLTLGTGSIFNNTVTIAGTAEAVTGSQVNNPKNASTVSGNVVIVSGTATRVFGASSNGSGDIKSNSVTITIGGTADSVFGGVGSASSLVIGNSVTISGTANQNVLGGFSSASGNVTGNSVTISGTVKMNVFGGNTTGSGNVTDNKVDISGNVAQTVYGGRINNASSTSIVSGNSVTVSGKAGQVVAGRNNGFGAVSGNAVTVSGEANQVVGGLSNGVGMVNNNAVTIAVSGKAAQVEGGKVDNANDTTDNVNSNIVIIDGTATLVYGGNSNGSGAVTKNTVVVNGTVDSAYGGSSTGRGDITANSVYVGNTANGEIYGGYSSGAGNVTDNKVDISGTANQDVYGGRINNADSTSIVSGNTVTVSGTAGQVVAARNNGLGAVSGNVVTVTTTGKAAQIIGGDLDNTNSSATVGGNVVAIDGTATLVYGGNSNGLGTVSDNAVTVSGEANQIVGGLSTGAGIVNNNTVTIAVSGKAAQVEGGKVDNANDTGNVNSNIVIIDGTATLVYGGNSNGLGTVINNTVVVNGTVASVYGGSSSGRGDITANSVYVGNTANGEIYGGYSSGTGNVTDNKVHISGTTNQDVYGSRIDNADSTGIVSGNAVTVSGIANSAVYAGYTNGTGTVDNNAVYITSTANLAKASLYGFNSDAAGSGNTLNVNGFYGDVKGIANFDTYNFVLGELAANQTFIHIVGNDPVNIDGSTISIDFAPIFHGTIKNPGDEIIIISKINADANPASVTVASSPYIAYNFIKRYDQNRLVLTLADIAPQPQTKVVAESFAASLNFLGQAADLRSRIYYIPRGHRFIPFAKMIYGSQHITRGSSVRVKGTSAIAGIAYNTDFDNGDQLIVGVFVEDGWGDYNSRHNFRNSGPVKGKGNTEYYGGGVLAHYSMENGLYGEGTFAAGKTDTDFRSRDFISGVKSNYDYSVPYYSAHLAVGKLLQLSDMLNLDVYAKYLWTHQNGDNVTMDGYRFEFKDADSHRLWVGTKLKADISPQLQPYAGVTYEYEFSGNIKGSLYGMDMDKPSLRGGTGIGELGLVWTPDDASNLRVDLGLQGYVGKREGISGGLTVSLSF